MNNNAIVKKASEYVFELFKEQLPDWAVYHNYDHTVNMVEAAEEIGQDSKLSDAEMEMVALAAWFHDTGYTMTADGYEDKSIELATKFLKERSYPVDKIAQVAACINATKPSES